MEANAVILTKNAHSIGCYSTPSLKRALEREGNSRQLKGWSITVVVQKGKRKGTGCILAGLPT